MFTRNLFVSSRTYLCCLAPLIILFGCGSGVPQGMELNRQKQVLGPDDEQAIHLNDDDQYDAWRKFAIDGKGVKRLIQKSFDLNFDGKRDFRRYYTATERVARDEIDRNFDGIFDQFVFYKNNQMIRKEISLSGDPKPEVIKYYDLGELKYVKYDKDRDSKFEYWEYYRGDKLVRIGRDHDLDGTPEKFEELD